MALAMGLIAGTGCQPSPPPGSKAALMAAADDNVVQTVADPNPDVAQPLGTWLRLVQAAGLVDYLSGPGPFTVFVPTDEAFSALPPLVQEDLLDPEHKDKLRAALLYHVHPGGVVLAADVRGPMTLSTGDAGQTLALTAADGIVAVNAAHVIRADQICHNGVIHWVDRVLLPAGVGR